MSYLKQWSLFLRFIIVCGWEGIMLPFNKAKRDMFKDNFGLNTQDPENPEGMVDAWKRWDSTHDYSHDGVNVAVTWGRLNIQRAVKFLGALLLIAISAFNIAVILAGVL